jgi:uncharacterized protein YbcV (DUF1398 family)
VFTIKQIDDIHTRLGKAETLFDYLSALAVIGVETYDSYVTDGHSEYFGKYGYKVVSSPSHEKLPIAETSHKDSLLEHLARHEQGQTTYLEMLQGLAESGIEKWTFDTSNMTMAYCDKAGNEVLVETISQQLAPIRAIRS